MEKHSVIKIRAARYFACDSHAHLVSKDGSVISSKSPSAVFVLRIPDESHVIVNVSLHSLSSIYGSVY